MVAAFIWSGTFPPLISHINYTATLEKTCTASTTMHLLSPKQIWHLSLAKQIISLVCCHRLPCPSLSNWPLAFFFGSFLMTWHLWYHGRSISWPSCFLLKTLAFIWSGTFPSLISYADLASSPPGHRLPCPSLSNWLLAKCAPRLFPIVTLIWS